MRAREATLLYIGQIVEFNDGRVATVALQDTEKSQVHLRFSDGTIGVANWSGLATVELIEA